jgi:hypothetical protein
LLTEGGNNGVRPGGKNQDSARLLAAGKRQRGR